MRDVLYVDVSEHLKRNKNKDYRETVLKNYTSLLKFCLKEELITGSYFESNENLKEDSKVYDSNLTDRGKPVFYKLMLKWFSYTDKTRKYDNEKILEKYLMQ